QNDLKLIPESGFGSLINSCDIEEKELVREGEVLGKQPVAGERAGCVGQQGLILTEANGFQARRRKHYGRSGARSRLTSAGRPDFDSLGLIEDDLIERVNQLPLALQIKPQAIAQSRLLVKTLLQVGKGCAVQAAKAEAQHRLGPAG